MNRIDILIVVDVLGALAAGTLQGYVYLVATNQYLGSAINALNTSWGVLPGELGNAANEVAQAEDARQAIVAQVWFDAACTT